VYLYQEKQSNVQVVGKFFAGKWSQWPAYASEISAYGAGIP
jgi:hypothetical protein